MNLLGLDGKKQWGGRHPPEDRIFVEEALFAEARRCFGGPTGSRAFPWNHRVFQSGACLLRFSAL